MDCTLQPLLQSALGVYNINVEAASAGGGPGGHLAAGRPQGPVGLLVNTCKDMGAQLLWDEDLSDLIIQGPRSALGTPADRVR
eukprot:1695171-Alexandrium_andersonii.AAC.1